MYLDGFIFQADRWLAIGRQYGRKSCQGASGKSALEKKGQTRYGRALGSRRTIFVTKNEEGDKNFQVETEHVTR